MSPARAPTALALALAASLLACGDRPRLAEAESASEVAKSPATGPARADSPSGGAPLVVLVSIDTLRADHLGLYGYARFTSPVLDGLAAESAVFEDASSAAPWTLPAHASLLTGLYPVSHGMQEALTELPAKVSTLAGILRAKGFTTAAVVNSGWLRQDVFKITRDFEKFVWVKEEPHRAAPTRWVTDQAIQWLEQRRADEPMLLFVHYYDVHADYASLPAYEKLFVGPYAGDARGTVVELKSANIAPVYLEYCRELIRQKKPPCFGLNMNEGFLIDEHFVPRVYDAADFAHLRDLYDAGVRQIDTELARLLAHLDEARLRERTLLIVVSDHGEELGDHGGSEHMRTLYQEVIRVPLLIRGRGVPGGARIATPVSLVDVAPTVLAYLGIPRPAAMPGLDLSPLWSGADRTGFEDRLIFQDAGWGGDSSHMVVELSDKAPRSYAVRRGRYKLYFDTEAKKRYRLFDLEADPGETRDVSPQHPELVAELTGTLEAHHAGVSKPPAKSIELDDAERERLRALGYL